MRNITLFISTSADGKITSESTNTNWIKDKQNSSFIAFFSEVDVLIMGRVTFERILAQGPWPFSGKKTYVFSKNLRNHFGTEIEVINRDPAAFIEELKPTRGNKIWLVGGAKLARTLMQEHLVDEVILHLQSDILGKGIDLFPLPLHSMFWELASTNELTSGVVQAHYTLKRHQE